MLWLLFRQYQYVCNDYFYGNRLVDGNNVTCSDEHMWLVPYTEGENHLLTISLPSLTPLLGIRVWNYNKSPECTYRGVRCVQECRRGLRGDEPTGGTLCPGV